MITLFWHSPIRTKRLILKSTNHSATNLLAKLSHHLCNDATQQQHIYLIEILSNTLAIKNLTNQEVVVEELASVVPGSEADSPTAERPSLPPSQASSTPGPQPPTSTPPSSTSPPTTPSSLTPTNTGTKKYGVFRQELKSLKKSTLIAKTQAFVTQIFWWEFLGRNSRV